MTMQGAESRADGRLIQVMLDLDRCEHGRYSIDPCLCCPGGKSTGNLLWPPGTLIGHGLGGEEIRVPLDREQRHDWRAWRGRLR